ncbi:MAG TPA: hypothetical protein VD996_01145 [Chitinophagaceae bacterium]|nr:hypothetical protein [Chitinophagaceae bacterium]
MPDPQKIDFLINKFPSLLRTLPGDAKGTWGVMNAQQMVEHFILSVKNASGKLSHPAVNEGERLQKFREFLFSDKSFKENTKNPILGEQPLSVHYPSMQAAIDKLQTELNYFADTFQKNPGLTTLNPIFGELDFDGNVQLLHKHALHHLRQFGLLASS